MSSVSAWSVGSTVSLISLVVVAAAIGQSAEAFPGAVPPGLPPAAPLLPDQPVMARMSAPMAPESPGATADSTSSRAVRRGLIARHVIADPGTLTHYRGRAGEVFLVRVTGNPAAGSVYGSETYTDDSALAAVVVHAGVLREGETGLVQVTILPGQANYDAATRHGITSYAYGPWSGSYRVDRVSQDFALRLAGDDREVIDDPGNLTGLSRPASDRLFIRVTGTTDGFVWGTGVYTSDSDLSTAAVHAGLAKPGETQIVQATILPGRSNYAGSKRNGVISRGYGSWGSSYRLSAVHHPRPPFDSVQEPVRDDPGNVTGFHRPVGATLLFRVTGTDDGFVWGTDAYTFDSDLSTAAVHAGVLRPGEEGVVRVTIQPVQFSFPGTERNGVISREWLPWDGNYRIDRADPRGMP